MHPNDISSATTSGVKAPNSLPWRQWRKNSHFNAFWGRNYVIVIFFTHYLWETMKWNQSFNLIKSTLLEDLVGSISYPHLLAGENDTFPD